MPYRKILKLLLVLLFLCPVGLVFAQDVIIRKDGRVIHAKVLEVGTTEIKYKKSEYLEGPTYAVFRSEVYAITYPNFTTDYLSMPDSSLFAAAPEVPVRKNTLTDMKPMQTLTSVIASDDFLKGIFFSVSLGIYNRYSKADDGIDDLAKLRSFPPVYLRFAKELNPSMKVGLQMGFARYRFASGDFSSFEQVFTTNDVRENIVSMIAYGKYQLKGDMVKPYGMAGIGFNTSRVGNRRRIDFVDGEQGILVNSVAQSLNLAVMIRGGADVQVRERLSIFGDFGLGISTFQLGTTFRLN